MAAGQGVGGVAPEEMLCGSAPSCFSPPANTAHTVKRHTDMLETHTQPIHKVTYYM